MMMANRKTLKF